MPTLSAIAAPQTEPGPPRTVFFAPHSRSWNSSTNTTQAHRGPVSTLGTVDLAPDYVGWDTLGPIIAVNACATAVVLVRLWTRKCIVRKVGWDDALIGLSLVLAWGISGVVVAGAFFLVFVFPLVPIPCSIVI